MKHSWKITLILIVMFFLAQLIGIFVISNYSPQVKQVTINATTFNVTSYNLPYGLEPPEQDANTNVIYIIISFALAITLMLLLMKYKIEIFLKLWFAAVIVLALSTTFFSFLRPLQSASLIAMLLAIPLAYFKIIRRNIIVHNITEVLIYPGIAAIFVPLLNIRTTIFLLFLISIYDIYAVWHAKFMQKMAKYQISKLGIFSGFFIPYISKSEIAKLKNKKKVKTTVAILGGGDIVFPMIFSGVLLFAKGIAPALFVVFGATLSLFVLFIFSEKGKFYPAMPFISAGCLLGFLVGILI